MKRQYELTYLPIGAVARVSFFLFVIIGFLIGILYGFMFAAFASFIPASENPFATMSPLMIMVLFPIMGAFFGGICYTLLNIIFVWLYNTIARFAGGIVLELELVDGEETMSRPNLSSPPSSPSLGPNPLPWSMPSNMSSTIGAPPESSYRPPSPPPNPNDDPINRS